MKLKLLIAYWAISGMFLFASDVDYRAICLEVVNKFNDMGLHASKPLDSEAWESITEEKLSNRHSGTIDLPSEAFSIKAEQALKLGNWKAYLPEGLEELEYELFSDYLNGWLKSRDKYASWEGDGASFRRDAHLDGKYRGIGVAWHDERGPLGELTVSWVVPGGAAEEAGVLVEDVVVGMISDTRHIDLSQVPLEDVSIYVRAADLSAANKVGNLFRTFAYSLGSIRMMRQKTPD